MSHNPKIEFRESHVVNDNGVFVPEPTKTNFLESNFTGGSMTGVVSQGSTFESCVFREVDVRHSSFSGTHFRAGHFFDMNIPAKVVKGAKFDFSEFRSVKFEGDVLLDVDFSGGIFCSGSEFKSLKTIKNVCFTDADLHTMDFSDIEFVNVDFSGANLQGVNFARCRMKNVKFHGAVLYLATFKDACLENNVSFSHQSLRFCNLEGAEFLRVDFSFCGFGDSKNVKFPDCVFRNCEMSNITFMNVDFESGYFFKTNLHQAEFDQCLLNDVEFYKSNVLKTGVKDCETSGLVTDCVTFLSRISS